MITGPFNKDCSNYYSIKIGGGSSYNTALSCQNKCMTYSTISSWGYNNPSCECYSGTCNEINSSSWKRYVYSGTFPNLSTDDTCSYTASSNDFDTEMNDVC